MLTTQDKLYLQDYMITTNEQKQQIIR